MNQVATALLFDCHNKLLIYLRDDKPEISYPGYWDLFGGRVEEGETPEQALVRELKEELNIDVEQFEFYKTFQSPTETNPNVKFVYVVKIAEPADSLTLYEGQYLKAIDLYDYEKYRFANILALILGDYCQNML